MSLIEDPSTPADDIVVAIADALEVVACAEAVVDAASGDLAPLPEPRLKRVVDVVVALLVLLLAAPVLLLAAAAIAIETRGPVLYRQRRTGKGGHSFTMFKLRSMVADADARLVELTDANETDGLLFKIKDDPRITRVGRVLRKLSIDELPQLVNVVRGEMSLVGPRPLPVALDRFTDADRRRLAVRPGITGVWQTSGRSSLGYDDMVDLDLAYIADRRLTTDLRILVRTVPAVLRGTGAC